MWSKFPDIYLTVEENPGKNLNKENDLTGDQTRACWVNGPRPQQWFERGGWSNLNQNFDSNFIVKD